MTSHTCVLMLPPVSVSASSERLALECFSSHLAIVGTTVSTAFWGLSWAELTHLGCAARSDDASSLPSWHLSVSLLHASMLYRGNYIYNDVFISMSLCIYIDAYPVDHSQSQHPRCHLTSTVFCLLLCTSIRFNLFQPSPYTYSEHLLRVSFV